MNARTESTVDLESFGSPRRWLALISISLSVAIIIVDSTIVNVAVPSVVKDLGITSSQVQWVQESYTLVFASFLLALGTIADRIGRRTMLLAGIGLFTLASVLAMVATDGPSLIFARLVQGFGGAAMLPTTLSLINANYAGKARGIAFAVWGSTIGGMAAVGPLLGGWLTASFSWRWAFGINIPIGALIIAGLLIYVDESRSPLKLAPDLVGALLSVLTFAPLVFGLIEGRTLGWWTYKGGLSFWTDLVGDVANPPSPVPVAFGIALVALGLFLLWCWRRDVRGKSSMVAFGLFKISSFRNGNIAAMIVSLGEFGLLFALPLWLQNALGYDALQTGWVLLGLAGGSFVASGFVGATSGKISAITVVRIGLVLEIVGLLVLAAVINSATPWYLSVLGLFFYGVGVGFATAQLTNVVLADVPREYSGQGSGTQSTARQLGSALGIAVLGTILFSVLGSQLGAKLDDRQVPAAQRDQIVNAVVDSAGGAIGGLEPRLSPMIGPDAAKAVVSDAKDALSTATQLGALGAAGFLGLGLLSSLSLGRKKDN